jgi:hypothetical protein
MSSPPPVIPWLQSISLEYHVTVALDGIKLSPDFVLPPDPAAVLDPDNGCVLVGRNTETLPNGKVVRTVDRLGLIDLTGGHQRGGIGDRLVRSLLIIGPTPVAGVAQVGRAFDGIADANGQLTIPVGSNGIDSDNCIYVPQTAMLRLTGMTATPGNPILVRIGIWQPSTDEELGEMVQACCCRANAIDEEGEPFFTTAIFSPAACARTVTTAVPPNAARGTGLLVVTLTGTNFAVGDSVTFIAQSGLGQIPVTSVTVMNATTILATIDVNGAVPLGAYDVVVAPPLAPPQCQGIGAGIFTVL